MTIIYRGWNVIIIIINIKGQNISIAFQAMDITKLFSS